jgi:membrane protein
MAHVLLVLWRVLWRVGPSQIGVIAAGTAFYWLLAVFPAITAVIALAGLFTRPEAVVTQLETLTRFVPADAAQILINEASSVAGSTDEGLSLAFALGVGFAIYLMTRATASLIHGLNIAHGRIENRSFFRYWLTVILLTATLVFGVAAMFVILVGVPTALAFVPPEIVPVRTADFVRATRWLVVVVLLNIGMAVLYRFGPADRAGRTGRKRPWRWLTTGSFLAALLWFAGSYGFQLYVTNFADYNASFGSLGGVIILLTWLWLSGFVVLFGAMVDAEIRRAPAEEPTAAPSPGAHRAPTRSG